MVGRDESKWNEGKQNKRKGKTELVVVSRIPELHEIYMDYYKIYQTENYCHSGVNIGEKNLQETEIQSRIAKYNRKLSMLYPLQKDRLLPRECEVVIRVFYKKPITLPEPQLF